MALSTVLSAVVGTVSTARTDLRYDVARFVQEEQASADRAVRADQYPEYRMDHMPTVRMRRRRFELHLMHASACVCIQCPRTRLRSVGHISSGKPLTASDASESDGANRVGHYPPTPPQKRQCCTGCADAYTQWRVPWVGKCACGTASTGTVTLAHGRARTVSGSKVARNPLLQ